jgi:hypothetical protein
MGLPALPSAGAQIAFAAQALMIAGGYCFRGDTLQIDAFVFTEMAVLLGD